MGAPDVLTIIACLVVFFVMYGYRLRTDIYLVAGTALQPYHDRLRKLSVARRVFVFVGLPLDGVVYLAYSLTPWAARHLLFAGLVADTVALHAAHSGLSWEETHPLLVKATVVVLGDDVPEVNRHVVEIARKKFEERSR